MSAAAGLLWPTSGMLLTLTLTALSVASCAIVAPAAGADAGFDAALIGPYLSACYVVAGIVGLLTGHAIRRFGAVATCQLALIACAAGLGLGASGELLLLVLSMLALGLGYGPFNPASAQVLTAIADGRWRPLVFSLKQLGVPLGGAIAGWLVPELVLRLGWQGALLVVAGLCAAGAPLLLPLRARFDGREQRGHVAVPSSLLAPLALVAGHRRLRLLSLTALVFAGCQLCALSYSVLFLLAVPQLDLATAGSVFSVMQLGGLAGRVLWGWMAGRLLRPTRVLALIGAVNVLACLLLASCAGAGLVLPWYPLYFVVGAASFGWNGVALSEVASSAPPGEIASATGGMQMVMFAFSAGFPAAFMYLVTSGTGFAAGYLLLSLLSLVGVLLVLLLEFGERAVVAEGA